MSAKAILEVAYQAGVVPKHLYGKTQQKTLQARLSEEILHHRETSPFYRTEPGQFFLTEFLDADDIPEEWKAKFPARRRTRDLTRDNMLGVKISFLKNRKRVRESAQAFFQAAEAEGAMAYMHPKEMRERGYCATWTFSVAIRDNCTLAYRVGRYRDNRDSYAKKRSVGFPGPLTINDATLFSRDRLGAEDSAADVLMYDLDLSYESFHGDGKQLPKIDHVMVVEADEELDVVIVLTWKCPKWFEPTTRRMSLNEPHWLCLSIQHNNLDDFEPWSAKLLAAQETEKEFFLGAEEANFGSTNGLPRV